MSKYLGPKLKLFPRIGLLYGFNNSLKNLKKKNFKKIIRFKESSKILIKKKRICFLYGIRTKQFKKLINNKKKTLFNLLESRLDCTIFRLGYSNSISEARQLISHRHFCINNKIINLPGYIYKKNDNISLSKFNSFQLLLKKKFEKNQQLNFSSLKVLKLFESIKSF